MSEQHSALWTGRHASRYVTVGTSGQALLDLTASMLDKPDRVAERQGGVPALFKDAGDDPFYRPRLQPEERARRTLKVGSSFRKRLSALLIFPPESLDFGRSASDMTGSGTFMDVMVYLQAGNHERPSILQPDEL